MNNVDIIVEGLNRYLEDVRLFRGVKAGGHFVLMKEVNIPSNFTKSIKEYVNNLYFVLGSQSYLIIKESHRDRSVTDNEEERCKNEVDIRMAQDIFFLFSQEVVMDLIIEGKQEDLKEIWHQVLQLINTRQKLRKNS